MSQRFFLLLLLAAGSLFIGCNNSDDKPDVSDKPKEFVLFDALIGYMGKPDDLTAEKISPMALFYSTYLTSPDPANPTKEVLDMAKINSAAEAALQRGVKFVCTDIETWYNDDGMGADSLKNNFIKMFDLFREKIAGVQISNYGIPFTNLNRSRYDNSGNEKALTEEAVMQNWKNASQKRFASVSAMDYLCPSVYLAVPNIVSWAYDLKMTVSEIRRIDSSKKIYVYMWPQYYDLADSPYCRKFIDPADWKKMLEHAFKYCDGVVLWGSSFDENGNYNQWSDPKIQAMFSATKEFIAEHASSIKLVE
jgi:hypothetical protein